MSLSLSAGCMHLHMQNALAMHLTFTKAVAHHTRLCLLTALCVKGKLQFKSHGEVMQRVKRRHVKKSWG